MGVRGSPGAVAATILAVLFATACGRVEVAGVSTESHEGGTSSDAATEPVVGDASVGPIEVDAAAVVDAATDTGDAEVVDLTTYDEARRRILAARNERWIKCFNAARELLELPQFDSRGVIDPLHGGLRYSVDSGRIGVDPARAQACLARFQTASCEDLAKTFAHDRFAFCDDLLVGTVPNGGRCQLFEDCQDPAHFACKHAVAADGCPNWTCEPRAALGESCDIAYVSNCLAGLACNGLAKCVTEVTVNQPCQDPGAPCAHELRCDGQTQRCVSDAVPQMVPQAGTPCSGTWDCVDPYVCLVDGPSQTGVCGVGHALGEPCFDQGRRRSLGFGGDSRAINSSNCAYDLACLAGPNGTACAFGLPTLASCILGGDIREPCTLGDYCARDDVCRPQGPEGSPCTGAGSNECQAPLVCVSDLLPPGHPGVCATGVQQIIPVGGPCIDFATIDCIPAATCNGNGSTPGKCLLRDVPDHICPQ